MCDLCGELVDCVVVYLRYRHMEDGRRVDSGHGALDICPSCLASRPRKSQYGRPTSLRIHDVA